jgi:hypothetical protein
MTRALTGNNLGSALIGSSGVWSGGNGEREAYRLADVCFCGVEEPGDLLEIVKFGDSGRDFVDRCAVVLGPNARTVLFRSMDQERIAVESDGTGPVEDLSLGGDTEILEP